MQRRATGTAAAGTAPQRSAALGLIGAAALVAVAVLGSPAPSLAQSGPAAHLPQAEAGAANADAVLRLMVDLQCPHSRKAWPLYREAARRGEVALLVHHLPVTRHAQARQAALAALAARRQGRELEFVDALLQSGGLDAAALQAAAEHSQLHLDEFARALGDPALAQALERERQAALAFGVQATPAALIAGRGLGGVPSGAGLQRLLAQARQRLQRLAAQLPTPGDVERAAMALAQPEFLAAFDALRAARADRGPAPAGAGALGQLYRVEVTSEDAALGPADAALTAVAYVDAAQPWTTRQFALLRQWQRQTPASRVVLRLMPADGRSSQRLALLWAAVSRAAGPRRAELLAALPDQDGWRQEDLLRAGAALGLDGARLLAQVDRPETTAGLAGVVEQARRIDAAPGALFINGQRWLGNVGDAGWTPAMAKLRSAFGRAGPAASAYAQLIQSGRWRQDAELDLQEPLGLGDLSALASAGSGDTEVVVLMDFSSPASRAAWHMLRRWIAPGPVAGRLRVAALPEGHRGAPQWNRALLAAAALGKTAAAVTALFDLPEGAPGAPAARQGLQMAKALGVSAEQWQQALQTASAATVQARLRALQQQTDWGEEPVIFLAGRLYTGPLDEARLDRALRFAARTALASPPPVRVAQEAP